MKTSAMAANTGAAVRRMAARALLAASLVFTSPLTEGCMGAPRPPPDPTCDTDLSGIRAQRYYHALTGMGESPANAAARWNSELECTPHRFARTGYAANMMRCALTNIADACHYNLGIRLEGYNRLQKLVYFSGPPGTVELSVPVKPTSDEQRDRGMRWLSEGLKDGVEAFNMSSRDTRLKLGAVSLDGNNLHVTMTAESRRL
jgi:hypothetical protein